MITQMIAQKSGPNISDSTQDTVSHIYMILYHQTDLQGIKTHIHAHNVSLLVNELFAQQEKALTFQHGEEGYRYLVETARDAAYFHHAREPSVSHTGARNQLLPYDDLEVLCTRPESIALIRQMVGEMPMNLADPRIGYLTIAEDLVRIQEMREAPQPPTHHLRSAARHVPLAYRLGVGNMLRHGLQQASTAYAKAHLQRGTDIFTKLARAAQAASLL